MTDCPDGLPSLDERILELTAAVHSTEPWSLGVTSLALARRLEVQETVLLADLARLVEAGALVRRFGYFALPGHAVALSAQQRELFEPLLPAEGDETPAAVSFASVSAAVRSAGVEGASKAFDTLLAIGALVRIGDDCYRGSQLAAMRREIDAHFRKHARLTVAEFRDLAGTTRKHAVPLLEWFDRCGVTRREGVDRTRGDADAI
ncbi:MAG TPA: SelB C-terminal domain-containing protein [Candidatus Tumulicola sp.]